MPQPGVGWERKAPPGTLGAALGTPPQHCVVPSVAIPHVLEILLNVPVGEVATEPQHSTAPFGRRPQSPWLELVTATKVPEAGDTGDGQQVTVPSVRTPQACRLAALRAWNVPVGGGLMGQLRSSVVPQQLTG